jgi:hypothetical protein
VRREIFKAVKKVIVFWMTGSKGYEVISAMIGPICPIENRARRLAEIQSGSVAAGPCPVILTVNDG